MKPTQEQSKEFWERYGFEHIPYKHLGTRKDKSVLHPQGITVISTQQECWIYPDGSKRMTPPDIDLNNLFKYAVPKLGKQVSFYYVPARVTVNKAPAWEIELDEEPAGCDEDPALALFWALDKVREASK